ncbi:MAG: rod shape-determining protein MreC [Clostridia bacterium]|nr:rod shape-determining protein MreC [Clostridia bacterium]
MAKRERTRLERLGRLLFVLLLIVLAALAGYSQHVNQTFFSENAMASALTPVQSLFSGAGDYVTDYMATLKLRGNVEIEYNRLRALNEQLMYRALFAEDLQYRNDYLLELFSVYNAHLPMNPLYARVVEAEPGNWFSQFTLDKGTRDGVKPNMAVISHTGMVGNVVEVYETSCRVITIVDSSFKIGGLIESSRDQGVVGGTLGIDGQPLCRMYYLPASSVPRPGDVVVTSGVGLPFPRGLVLGTVRESTRLLEENKYYVVVEPTADFQHIEDVLILRYVPTIEVRPVGEEIVEQPIMAAPTVRPQPSAPGPDNATPQPLPNAPGRPAPTPSPFDNGDPNGDGLADHPG